MVERCQLQNKLLLLIFVAVLTACAPVNDLSPSGSASRNESAATVRLIDVSAPHVNAGEPSVAAGNEGSVFVVWVEHRENDADLMIRQYDSSGQPRGGAVRVNPQPGQVKSWFGAPPTVRVGRDGAVYVGWTAKAEASRGAANVLYLSVSRDNGNSFQSPVKVNDDIAPASHGMHSLAVDGKGRIYLAWLDERYLNARQAQTDVKKQPNATLHDEKDEQAAFSQHAPEPEDKAEPNAELYFAVSTDDGKTFSPNRKLAGNVCPCCKTALLAAADDRLYVSWRQVLPGDYRHIAVASSADAGNSFSPPVIISDDQWQISACPVSGAALSENSGKTLDVAWFTAGEAGKQGIYVTESKDAGKTFSPRTLIGENAVGGTPALAAGAIGTQKIVWTEDDKIVIASLSNEKKTVENKQQIAEGKLPVTTISGEQTFVGFVARNNGTGSIKLFITK